MRRLKTSRASFPQLPYVSTARGMHNHPKSWHLASLVVCFLPSATRPAAPSYILDMFRIARVRGEVTVTSKAAWWPLSQNKDVCWARVDVLPAQAITHLYLHREASPTTESCQDVSQEVVLSDHETSMPTRNCMMS